MANPYTDQRALLARLQQQNANVATPRVASSASPGPLPSKAGITLSNTATNMAITNPALRSKIEAIASNKPKNTSIVGKVFKPLELLALPGRAVVGTLREGIDAIDGNPNTDSSFGDFRKNMADPTFGFGKAFKINTGNIWLDRGIGLVGDLALDPLTYLTAGAGKFAGATGHIDMAGAVLKLTKDAGLAGRVAKYGRGASGLTDEILQGIGANRHGIYMFGKRLGKAGEMQQGFRIPGTGALGQMTNASLSRLRVSAMGTKGGKFLQKITMPKDALAARVALRQGTLSSDDAVKTVIGALSAEPIQRMSTGTIRQAESVSMDEFLKQLDVQGLESYGQETYRLIHSDDVYRAATPEERAIADAVKEKFGYFETNVDTARQGIDDTSPPFGMRNYFPMMQTDDAIAFRANGSAAAEELNTIYRRDPLEGGRNFRTRTLEEGDMFFGHKLTKEDIAGGIERFNELATREGTGFTGKFFETDVRKVLTKYVDSYADEMGLLAKHKHLVDSGFWTHADNVTTGKYVLDDELVKSIKKNVKSLNQDLKGMHYNLQKAHIGFSDSIDQYAKQLEETLAGFKGATGELGQMEDLARNRQVLEDALAGTTTATADELKLLGDNLGSMKSAYAKFQGLEVSGKKLVMAGTEEPGSPSLTLDGLVSIIDNAQQEAYALGEHLDAVIIDKAGQELADIAKASEQQLALVEQRIKDLKPKLEKVTAFANQVEGALDALTNGTSLDNFNEHAIRVVAMAMRDNTIGSNTVRDWINETFKFTGRVETQLRELNNTPGSLFERLNSITSTMKMDDVTKMTPAKFYENLTKMFTNELKPGEVRAMGVYALLQDTLYFGDNVPELIRPLRAKLEAILKKSAEAELYAESVRKAETAGSRLSATRIFDTQWAPAYSRVQNDIDMTKQLDEFAENFDSAIASLNDPEILDSVMPESMLERYYDKYPYLEHLFPTQVSAENWMIDLMDGPVVSNNALFDGMRVSDAPTMGRSERDIAADGLTFRQFREKVKEVGNEKRALLDQPVYEVGPAGVTRRAYTGKEVIKRVDRVNKIQRMLGSINLERERKAASMLIHSDRYVPELATPEALARFEELKLIKQKRVFTPVEKKEHDAFVKAANLKVEMETRAGQIIKPDRYQELRAELTDLAGGGTLLKPEWFTSTYNVQQDLANSILEYQMVSEVHTRFNAVAMYAEEIGQVPTERWFATVASGVSNKFMPILDGKVSDSYKARALMKVIDGQMTDALIAGGKVDGVSAGKVFQQIMAGLSEADRATLSSVIGHRVSWGADPYSIYRGKSAWFAANVPADATAAQGRRMWIENVVQPWYEKAFPDGPRYLDTMENALKNETSRSKAAGRRKQLMTPWADDATPDVVKSWFEDILGQGNSTIPGRRARAATFATAGEIDMRIRGLKKVRSNFKSMLAPDMNMQDFFTLGPSQLQGTPSLYASLLKDHADNISRKIVDVKEKNLAYLGTPTVRGGTVREVGDIAELIQREQAKLPGYLDGSVPLPDKMTQDFKIAIGKKRAQMEADDVVADAQKAFDDSVALKPELDSINKTAKTRWLTKEEKARKAEIEKQVKQVKDALTKAKGKRKKVEKLTPAEEKFFVGLVDDGKGRSFEYEAPREPIVPRGKKALAREAAEVPISEDAMVPREAARALAQYNDAMATPMHGKAKQDEHLIKVMQALAGYDMHNVPKFVSASDGSSVATYAIGNPITFSDAQWRSLFHGYTPDKLALHRGKAQIELTRLRGEVRGIDGEIARLNQQYSDAVALYEQLYAKNPISAARRINSLRKEIADLPDEIKLVEAERRSLASAIEEQQVVIESLSDGIQSVALGKLKILAEGRFAPDGEMVQAPIFDDNGLARWLANTHPTQQNINISRYGSNERITQELAPSLEASASLLQKQAALGATQSSISVTTSGGVRIEDGMRAIGLSNNPDKASVRAANLMKIWKETPEYAHLQRMSQLESNSFMSMFFNQQKTVATHENSLNEVLKKIETTIADTVKANEELSASRARALDVAQQGSDSLTNLRGTGVTVPQEEFVMPGYPDWNTYEPWMKRDIIKRNKAAYDDYVENPKYPDGKNKPVVTLLPEVPEAMPAEPFPLSALSTPEEIRAYAARMEQQAIPSGPLFTSATGGENLRLSQIVGEQMGLQQEWRAAVLNAVDARKAANEWRTGTRGTPLASGVGYSDESQQALRALEAESPSPSLIPKGREAAAEVSVPRKGGQPALEADIRARFKDTLTRLTSAQEIEARVSTRLNEIEHKILSYGVEGDTAAFWTKLEDNRVVADLMQQRLDDVQALIDSRPDEAIKVLKDSIKGRRTSSVILEDDVQEALNLYRQWRDENFDIIRDATTPRGELEQPVYDAWAKVANADIELIDLQLTHSEELRALARAQAPVWHETTFTPLERGFKEAAEASGMLRGMSKVDGRDFPSLYGNTEALDLLKDLERLKTPGVSQDLAKFMGAYTGYFRSYATLSPGFHVRNTISNVFSIFTAGADIRSMNEGFRLWRKLNGVLNQGGTLSDFVSSLPADQQMAARRAGEIMFGMGGGKTSDALRGFVEGGNALKDNRFLRFSRRTGNKVEGSAHFMLAYDGLMKGFTPEQAFNRTRRYLVDYQSRTILDDSMRDIIPFWTWMSRNLPLQIMNRWSNPKAYLVYDKIIKNMSQDDGSILPEYLQKRSPINLGGGNFLNPDLPITGIDQQISDITNPNKWLSYVNPGIRTPIELMTNRNTFSGQPFDNSYVPISAAIKPFVPILSAMGQIEHNAQGEQVVSRKALYALTSMNPVLARADKLLPSDVESVKGGNTLNSFLGIPITQVDAGMQDSERYRRIAQLRALAAKQKDLGFGGQ